MFQGQTVGPAGKGRPENPIQQIVLEPGDRKFEGNNVGLFYTAMSWAATIGNMGDRMSSAVYFDSPHFSKERFTNLTRQKNRQMYHRALLRQNWVRFMKEKNKNRKKYTKEEMKKLFHWITTTRINLNTKKKKLHNQISILRNILKTNTSKIKLALYYVKTNKALTNSL
jgi:hypothetical protein